MSSCLLEPIHLQHMLLLTWLTSKWPGICRVTKVTCYQAFEIFLSIHCPLNFMSSRLTHSLGDDVSIEGQLCHYDEDKSIFIVHQILDENFIGLSMPDNESLSGRGDVTSEDSCGTFRDFYVREDREKGRPKQFTCHLQSCPKCFRIWARRQAEKTAGYLWALSEKYAKSLAHWTLSPSEEKVYNLSPAEVWSLLDKMLKDIVNEFSDVQSCILAVTRHPGRKRCPVCGLTGPKLDHQCVCPVCFEKLEWYWSPHLHVITDFEYSEFDKDQYVQYEKVNGLIFSYIASPPDKANLANILSYELGHARYIKGETHPAVRYFGFSSRNHFRCNVVPVTEEVIELVQPDTPFERQLRYYKVQPQMWNEEKPGFITVNRMYFQGSDFPWYKDIMGQRVPLTKTTYLYQIEETMFPLKVHRHGKIVTRWLRVVPPRNQKTIRQKDSRKSWDTMQWENNFVRPGRFLPVQWFSGRTAVFGYNT